MTPLPVTRDQLREHTAGGSFERGRQYFHDGAVQSVERTDDHTLKAKVQGSNVHPYVVTVQFEADHIAAVECTCPYYEGSWCKHVVATVLKVLDSDEVPKSDPAAVADLLADMDRDQLSTLIERLVEHAPRLLDQIERERARLIGESDPSDGTA
ncbi:putative Zn finger protein [Salinibacter ruber]|uniref:SWIM zinc finger family protein n=1 Tax=Salinibacter ruber TaxID=146919 RepID=UPI002166F0B9|nr:SWIM zinc finger family protein [Salinibacter ruber]MCS3650954.1 putative Zn finger protein [Salinibacter ruber]MCS3654208.1 putative Zn finger protein [Salinibacter ruber]